MTRGFSLAGLLRVRGIQERAAAERLSRAAIEAEQTASRDRHLRAALAGAGSDAVDVRSLAALAAARVAGRSLLADLESLATVQERALEDAREDHAEARRDVRGLERLAQAHALRLHEADLRAEQLELDEIAARAGKGTEA
jgi:flagellar export protein FliJ